MNKARLEKLATFLENLQLTQNDAFAMGIWGASRTCGFAGCAIGWATHNKLFEADGFYWSGWEPTFCLTEDGQETEYMDWAAVEQFFNLSAKDAEYLFCASNYLPNVTHVDVAARIKEMLGNAS